MENDNDNGVIVKIYKSYVNSILVGGHLRRPQTKMGIPSGLIDIDRVRAIWKQRNSLKVLYRVPKLEFDPKEQVLYLLLMYTSLIR